MAFVQRDILMQQIEVLGAWLGKQLNAGADPVYELEEAECERAAGFSLDVAASLPANSVSALVTDGASLVVLGLGLARRALDRKDASLAAQAHALWSAGVVRAPEFHDADVEAQLLDLLQR